jgi:hypothetical protein
MITHWKWELMLGMGENQISSQIIELFYEAAHTFQLLYLTSRDIPGEILRSFQLHGVGIWWQRVRESIWYNT